MKPYGDDCVVAADRRLPRFADRAAVREAAARDRHQKEKKPTYALFAYNCNMFMSDVAKSVGILPPKNNYKPSLDYFYDMMDRNEGRKRAANARRRG